jgi:hypothetical protein
MGDTQNPISDLIDEVDWTNYDQPEWNEPNSVPSALLALAMCENEDVYTRLLSALGNNNAGTYFPVAIPAVTILGIVVSRGEVCARMPALCVLEEYAAGSFCPEPTYKELFGEMRKKLVGLRPIISEIVSHESVRDLGERELAKELLDALDKLSQGLHK